MCSDSIAACMECRSLILTSESSSASNWLGRIKSASLSRFLYIGTVSSAT